MRTSARIALCLALITLSCRNTNPVRTRDGTPAKIELARVAEANNVSWRIVKVADALRAAHLGDIHALKQHLLGKPNAADWAGDEAVSTTRALDTDGTLAVLPQGDYGSVYLLQVVEKDAQGAVVQNSVRVLDDRDDALGVGAEIGLLFMPELDGVVTSTLVSIYPGRLWAIDSKTGVGVAQWTDRISIDAGIVGGSVVGDAPPELGGRTAFSFGLGFFLAKGWSAKSGLVVYRDATEGDDLAASAYWGITYDLLSAFAGN